MDAVKYKHIHVHWTLFRHAAAVLSDYQRMAMAMGKAIIFVIGTRSVMGLAGFDWTSLSDGFG